MVPDRRIDVLVVDRDPTSRAALRAYLDATGGLRIVGESAGGPDAVAAARRLRPTVTVVDHCPSAAAGLPTVAALARYTSVLVLTGDASAQLALAMLRGGARGYLVHGQFERPDVVRAVRAVAAGQAWLSPTAAMVAALAVRDQVELERAQRLRAGRDVLAQARFGLTPREQEVLALLCRGLSNAAIAGELALTEKTVKNHLHHIFSKLQVASRTEAVVRWSSAR